MMMMTVANLHIARFTARCSMDCAVVVVLMPVPLAHFIVRLYSLSHTFTHIRSQPCTRTHTHTLTHTPKRFAQRCLRARALAYSLCTLVLPHTHTISHLHRHGVRKEKKAINAYEHVCHLLALKPGRLHNRNNSIQPRSKTHTDSTNVKQIHLQAMMPTHP